MVDALMQRIAEDASVAVVVGLALFFGVLLIFKDKIPAWDEIFLKAEKRAEREDRQAREAREAEAKELARSLELAERNGMLEAVRALLEEKITEMTRQHTAEMARLREEHTHCENRCRALEAAHSELRVRLALLEGRNGI